MKIALLMLAFLGVLISPLVCAASNSVNPADYTIPAKIISVEDVSQPTVSPLYLPSTGTSVNVYNRVGGTRVEVEINGTIYITDIFKGCRHCQPALPGQTYQVRMYSKHKTDFIAYLQQPAKGTELKEVVLRITGLRVKP